MSMIAGLGLLRRTFRPRAAATPPIERPAPRFQGYVDEHSPRHVAGWVHDLASPGRRVPIEVVLTDPDGRETVVATDLADRRSAALRTLGIGDAAHGFHVLLPPGLSGTARERLHVRPAGGAALEISPWLVRSWEPVRFVAMDIVDNCNLRCPFCLYDYSAVHRTNVMPEPVFEAALRLLPFTTDLNFWMSCLHEPTLHPRLPDFVTRIPPEWAAKAFFTTDLAKRLTQAILQTLAASHLAYINISIESLRPDIYEMMRKGARHSVFTANWDALLAAFAAAAAPPRLRYIVLAYRSNVAEIPALVDHLLNERRGWQVEVRYTYPEPHIPAAFLAAEQLADEAWPALREALSRHPADRVILVEPPIAALRPGAPEALPGRAPARTLEMRMQWDGTMVVRSRSETDVDHTRQEPEFPLVTVNVAEIGDMDGFLAGLVA